MKNPKYAIIFWANDQRFAPTPWFHNGQMQTFTSLKTADKKAYQIESIHKYNKTQYRVISLDSVHE